MFRIGSIAVNYPSDDAQAAKASSEEAVGRAIPLLANVILVVIPEGNLRSLRRCAVLQQVDRGEAHSTRCHPERSIGTFADAQSKDPEGLCLCTLLHPFNRDRPQAERCERLFSSRHGRGPSTPLRSAQDDRLCAIAALRHDHSPRATIRSLVFIRHAPSLTRHFGDAMLMLLYSAALTVGLILSSPWWLFRMLTTERYREGLSQRLGHVPQALREAVQGRRVIWLHAVSVGEVLAASRLVTELETALGENWRVVISTTTRTGQALARERFGADRVFYFPLDFAFAVRAYMRALKPDALVLMESELWPRVLHEFQQAHAPVVVVNARVSDRSFARGMRVRSIWGRMLRKVTLWLAQSDEDARRLVAVGARPASVHVGGNLKYDIRAPKESRVAELIRTLAGDRSILVAGSTVVALNASISGEEALVVGAWTASALSRNVLLVLAPRHPERFDEVWNGHPQFLLLRASDLLSGESAEAAVARMYSDKLGPEHVDIVLLDTIGDLASVYGIADIAFVGGSLLPRGGHNPLEPAQFGVPVIMGPSFENFRDIVADLQQSNGIRIVKDQTELAATFEHLLADKQAARAMGENGRTVFLQQQGATCCAVEAIMQLVRGALA